MELKITLIGAGSVVFAKTLICDILQFPELQHATICLMDIDPQRLKVAEIMTKKIIQKLGVPAKVEATRDRRQAIRGARYVICTIQVGGYKPGTIIDFEIPKKYGLQQTIGDTLGIGGIFRALRTIPVMNAIARDIADVGAPGCLFINYSNPMAMNCWGVDRGVGIPHVGLCHSVQGTAQQLASFAKLPFEDITYQVAGINHMAFFLKFQYKGQDAYPLLFRLLNDPRFTQERVRFEMMRRTGYFVTESSEHQSEYTPYFIHHGNETIKRFDIPIDEYLRRCDAIIASWEETEAALLGKKSGFSVRAQSHEYGSFIIHSRETNTPRVVYGNVPNHDLICNLPEGCCVEVPCLVDAQGIQPTHIGHLPPQLAALCQTNINVQGLTVEAALTGKREHIYHAAMMDPHTAATLTLDKIWDMCDKLIAAHQKVGLLAAFKPVVKNTGRSYDGLGDRIIATMEAMAPLHSETAEIPLKLIVANPGAAATRVHLSVEPVDQNSQIVGPEKIIISLGAKKTVASKLSIRFSKTPEKSILIRLSSQTPNVFTRDLVLEPRKLLRAQNGSARCDFKLAGFPAAEASISQKNGALRFRYHVLDSKITPNLVQPWTGSIVEIFLADLNTGHPFQFCCIPRKGSLKPLITTPGGTLIRGAKSTIKSTPMDYHMEIDIPLAAAQLNLKSRKFLFDSIVGINALGDAHSGGRASLTGHWDAHVHSTHYAMVDLG